MTPRLVERLLDRRLAERRAADQRAGTLAALITNICRPKNTAPVYPADFFPLLDGPRDALSPAETAERIGELIAKAKAEEDDED